MTKTQDQIWHEMHVRMSADTKERREETRKNLLDILAASFAGGSGINENERRIWIEEQKALINEFFRLRDRVAPRFVGQEDKYQDDGVQSKEELRAALSDLKAVVREISSRVSLESLDADQLEQWREINPHEEVRRATDKLRWLSRLPQSDPRIDELLFQYHKWDKKAQRRSTAEQSKMSRLGLVLAALFDPNRIILEKQKIAEAARSEGFRDGLRLALWAFDYAPERADSASNNGRSIPLPQLGTAFWRSGDHTP
jgi:hypothetical protein